MICYFEVDVTENELLLDEVSMCYRRNRMYREVQMPQLRKYDPDRRSFHCTGYRKKTKKKNGIQLREKMWN